MVTLVQRKVVLAAVVCCLLLALKQIEPSPLVPPNSDIKSIPLQDLGPFED
jgi:hypothetical protein